MDSKQSETTRLLCEAAYSDSAFAATVAAELTGLYGRRLAPSPGVDMATVAAHCLVAGKLADQRRERGRLAAIGVGLLALALMAVDEQFVQFSIGIAIFAYFFWRSKQNAPRVTRPAEITIPPKGTDEGTALALARLQQEEQGNLTVYGAGPPFIGSGRELSEQPAWRLTVAIDRGRHEPLTQTLAPVEPFEVDELHDHLAEALEKLAIPNLVIEDRIYLDVDEYDQETDWRLGWRPLVQPDVVRAIMRHPTPAVRHYKVIRVIARQGQLVLSVFLHLEKLGDSLFAEARYHLLTPVSIGAVQHVQSRQPWGAPTNTAATTPQYWLARTSIRERASDHRLHRYFQQLDKVMHAKVIEQRLLAAIINFLDGHGVDTAELVKQRASILNHGVIVSGGMLNADNLAVGGDASAGDFLGG